jgi:hypothetical protein
MAYLQCQVASFGFGHELFALFQRLGERLLDQYVGIVPECIHCQVEVGGGGSGNADSIYLLQ